MADQEVKPNDTVTPETGFSRDYVEELRQEAAGWRTKYREMEEKVALGEVATALAARGINAEATWVKREKGEPVEDAIARFVEARPQLNVEPQTNKPMPKIGPKPISLKNENSNKPGPGANGSASDIETIKKDPKARSQLRSQYRQLLAQSSNKPFEE